MSVRVAVLAALLSTSVLLPVSPVHAAQNADEWRGQLQAELERIAKRSPMMKIEGPVSVQEQDNALVATLPILTIVASDSSRWSVPAITLRAPITAARSGPVTIQLPTQISYRDASGSEISRVDISSQNISGNWNYADSHFTTLQGALNGITYVDHATKTQSNVENVSINANNVQQPKISASQVTTRVAVDGAVNTTTLDQATLSYQFADGQKMTLTRVIGLLNPVWLLADKQEFTMGLDAQTISNHDEAAASTRAIGSMSTRLQILPNEDGSSLGGRLSLTLNNVTQQPEPAYGFILPKKLSLLGTASNIPANALGQPFHVARGFMEQAGTRSDISELIWDTAHDSSMKGNGWVKAQAGVPLGMVGRLNLTITNLRALTAAVQKQLSAPGTNMAAKTQGLMALMVLQSIARENNQESELIVDMTADGQVLVNDQNIAPLIPSKGKSGQVTGANAATGGNLGAALGGLTPLLGNK